GQRRDGTLRARSGAVRQPGGDRAGARLAGAGRHPAGAHLPRLGPASGRGQQVSRSAVTGGTGSNSTVRAPVTIRLDGTYLIRLRAQQSPGVRGRRLAVDLTAGAHASADAWPPRTGTAGPPGAPTQRDVTSTEIRLTDRLRAILPWPGSSSAEPVADLLRSHRQIHPHSDVGALRRSYTIAERMHRGQLRKSGEPYI